MSDDGYGDGVEDDRHPREDDRNEEVPESPVPDPTEGDTNAGDIPEAD